jgi:hypothetical protein
MEKTQHPKHTHAESGAPDFRLAHKHYCVYCSTRIGPNQICVIAHRARFVSVYRKGLLPARITPAALCVCSAPKRLLSHLWMLSAKRVNRRQSDVSGVNAAAALAAAGYTSRTKSLQCRRRKLRYFLPLCDFQIMGFDFEKDVRYKKGWKYLATRLPHVTCIIKGYLYQHSAIHLMGVYLEIIKVFGNLQIICDFTTTINY